LGVYVLVLLVPNDFLVLVVTVVHSCWSLSVVGFVVVVVCLMGRVVPIVVTVIMGGVVGLLVGLVELFFVLIRASIYVGELELVERRAWYGGEFVLVSSTVILVFEGCVGALELV
jgi:hypothetical protein